MKKFKQRLLTIAHFAKFAGKTILEVEKMIEEGKIAVVITSNRRRFIPLSEIEKVEKL